MFAQGTVRAYLSAPQFTGFDYQFHVLENVTPGPGCRIRIAMGHWSDSGRGRAMIDKLNQLHAGGCDVRAMYGQRECSALHQRANFPLKSLCKLHAKFMLVNGTYYDDPRRLVWVGSSNFTHGSGSYDDESILRIDRSGVYDMFDDYFDDLYSEPSGNCAACN